MALRSCSHLYERQWDRTAAEAPIHWTLAHLYLFKIFHAILFCVESKLSSHLLHLFIRRYIFCCTTSLFTLSPQIDALECKSNMRSTTHCASCSFCIVLIFLCMLVCFRWLYFTQCTILIGTRCFTRLQLVLMHIVCRLEKSRCQFAWTFDALPF